MASEKTIYQRLQQVLNGNRHQQTLPSNNKYIINGNNDIIDTANSKEEYNVKLLQAKQQKLLSRQWVKAQYDITNHSLAGLNDVKLMYRDCDLMDDFPEIGTALDIFSEESCTPNDKGFIVNVSSKSERIKSILEDLFTNKLDINMILPMISRSMCKYGNTFMLLNIDHTKGVTGWKQLPVYEIERYENGMECPYASAVGYNLNNVDEKKLDNTKFIWVGQSEYIPYREFQIAHFRLLYDSRFLPYGVSALNKARRHFRMLSMMEDMMLVYRLDRSVERRVFKINVGAIDEADVQSYVQTIADNFKRTPIIDPMTGQIDLRKNVMPVWKKTPIPLLDGRTITIEDLAKEYENGKINYVYSVQEGTKQIVPGKVVWCGKNYTAKTMIKITLDDDSYMVMAPEHEIIMRNGLRKRADKVCVGESVMPFYRKLEPLDKRFKADYEQIYNPNSGQYEFTHRLIAKELNKEKDETVIHHLDINRLNNSPSNLKWMRWDEHKNLHIALNADPSVRKNRSLLKHKLWNVGNNREIYSKNMRVDFDEYVWENIEDAVINGEIYSQKSMVNYINDNLIDYLIKTNSSRKLKHNRRISKITVRERIHSLGFADCDEYLNSIETKYHLNSHYSTLRKRKSETAKKMNASSFFGNNRKKANYTITFNDNIWNELREKILDGTLKTGKEIQYYINNNLISEIISECKVNIKEISLGILLRQIRNRGFEGTKDYIDRIRKNHKIKKIELINGDDVYCMTVVGLNGEQDRHNFALRTFAKDGGWNESGCFVSNCNLEDFFIPVRDDNAPNPIETLSAGQNLTAMDDIKYIQNKIVTALRIPKSFLNFEETQGDGKNLSLLDVRFTRTVKRFQQSLLMELNKIAIIHLCLLGFFDELNNFSLTMNNPSSQAELLEIENLAKKITTAKDAVSDPGSGIPLTSMTWAWKNIMKWSDKEIQRNLEEIRLETALAAELQKTMQIIKKTNIFDAVDNIYGEPGAEYQDGMEEDGGQGDKGGIPSGGGLPTGVGDMDFGDGGMETGEEGDMPMSDAANEDNMEGMESPGNNETPSPNLGEMILRNYKNKISEDKKKLKKSLLEKSQNYSHVLINKLANIASSHVEEKQDINDIYLRNLSLNEELTKISEELKDISSDRSKG